MKTEEGGPGDPSDLTWSFLLTKLKLTVSFTYFVIHPTNMYGLVFTE